ncbi:MAG: class I SAM-dependent methyltransferase [Tistlia sp.]|uniref:class I SAM-dependent methyltransferase n=1 Tax=Tistlia sp. TaxID=3057121 RepID=UPI0034A30C52
MQVVTVRQETDLVDYYDRRYQDGYMDRWESVKVDKVLEFVGEAVGNRPLRLLDYGCGTGEFAGAISRRFPQLEVWGCDLSPEALARARRKHPGLRFATTAELQESRTRFDLLFTHHVIEHVFDLEATLAEMAALLAPGGEMVHILPCGNPGSLEQRLVARIEGGIEGEGRRFFFEDPGHLRRLTSDDLARPLGRHGFALRRAWYANQSWGGVRWLTANLADAAEITPVARGRNPGDRLALAAYRSGLVGLALLRHPGALWRRLRRADRRRFGPVKRAAYLAAWPVLGVLRWPSTLLDVGLTRLAEAEWRDRREQPHGSEMYLYFVSQGPEEAAGAGR